MWPRHASGMAIMRLEIDRTTTTELRAIRPFATFINVHIVKRVS
jgi:hypothetical protein